MNLGQLRKVIEGLPDEMELVGECSTGQEDIDAIKVCQWEQGGFYFADDEEVIFGEIRTPNKAERVDLPILKIIVEY